MEKEKKKEKSARYLEVYGWTFDTDEMAKRYTRQNGQMRAAMQGDNWISMDGVSRENIIMNGRGAFPISFQTTASQQ